jgi:carbon storage regulator
MLVLSRRVGEEIVIADHIRVIVAGFERDRVRLGICAPPDVTVDRAEVHRNRVNGRQGTIASSVTSS